MRSMTHVALLKGPLKRREARLAWGLLTPTFVIIALVVVFPLLAVFWISFKPVTLTDLRAPQPLVKKRFLGKPQAAGDALTIRYLLRNSSRQKPIEAVELFDVLPKGFSPDALPEPCSLNERALTCRLGDFRAGFRKNLRIKGTISKDFISKNLSKAALRIDGSAQSALTNAVFTLDNFRHVFSAREFLEVLEATIFYTFFGTLGALILGLFAALLLNRDFFGKGFFRGLYLFPYIAPTIAVAFTWVTLFDPFSGAINTLLMKTRLVDAPINFFGERGLALVMVTLFEIWRYFPLSFLFILARMQSINTEIYEAADMDGASPFQKFRYLSLPHLMGVLSLLFLLRFIWTFNKFDDIFLLTGGGAGTRTLTVSVYEQAFAISDLGAGAAVAVVIFVFLLMFSALFFHFINKEDGV